MVTCCDECIVTGVVQVTNGMDLGSLHVWRVHECSSDSHSCYCVNQQWMCRSKQ